MLGESGLWCAGVEQATEARVEETANPQLWLIVIMQESSSRVSSAWIFQKMPAIQIMNKFSDFFCEIENILFHDKWVKITA